MEIILTVEYGTEKGRKRKKSVEVCSEVIRTEFAYCDAFHYRRKNGKNKRFVFAENDFGAHVVIVKSDGERVKWSMGKWSMGK